MKVLVFVSHYLPGFRAGGPIQSISNMTERLGTEIDFSIVTSDRDLGAKKPYTLVSSSEWQSVGNAMVRYLSPSQQGMLAYARCIREKGPDVIYINGFFNPRHIPFFLLLLQRRLLSGVPIVVAPRGEFGKGALALKSKKKQVYLGIAKSLGIAERVLWQATSEQERQEIRQVMGSKATICLASNLSSCKRANPQPREEKKTGYLKLCYLSRISRKKNLLEAIKMVNPLNGEVEFDIWGPVEDLAYNAECEREIQQLPDNIRVVYRGAIASKEVAATLAKYDALLLPTLNENYGHVIVESLVAGCPVVISDCTPWRGLLDLGVGWDLPLEERSQFQKALASLVAMEEKAHCLLRRRAADFGRKIVTAPGALQDTRALFTKALLFGSKQLNRAA